MRTPADEFDHVWRWRTQASPWAPGVRLVHPFAERVGEPLRVLCRGSKNSILIEFEADGLKAVVSRHAVRRRDPSQLKSDSPAVKPI